MSPSGALFSAASAVLYGSSYVVTAIALVSFSPLSVAMWRGLIGAALLGGLLVLPPLVALRPRRPTRGGAVRLLALGLIGGAAFVIAMNVGVAAAGATVTAFVAGLYAVTAAALAIPVLGEPLERSTLLALLAALIGTVLLSGIRLETDTVVGIGSALIAAAAFGTYLVLSRRWGESHGLRGPLVGLSTLTISGIVAAVAVQLTGAPVVPAAPRPEALVAIAWLAVGPSATAAVLVVAGMQRLEARHASVFLLLNPPTAAILAYLLLGERLSALQLVGGACVLVAIAAASGLVVLRDRRR